MATKKKNNKQFLKKMKARYRLMIYDDNTFQTKWSIRISRIRVIKWSLYIIIPIVLLTSASIVFTPLREYIPGYPAPDTQSLMVKNTIQADSLENQLQIQKQYLESIKAIIEGEVPEDDTTDYVISDPKDIEMSNYQYNHDSIFQEHIAQRINSEIEAEGENRYLSYLSFVKPIDGIVTDGFDASTKHYAIDVTSKVDSPVFATLDGTVIQASWSEENGFVIIIQHNHNLVSLYKHNVKLLKQVGDKVEAGDRIALMGNTGTLTTGPHLHFELWHLGTPLNPAHYIDF